MSWILIADSSKDFERGLFGFGAIAFAMFLYGRVQIHRANANTASSDEVAVSGLLFNRREVESSLFKSAILLVLLFVSDALVGLLNNFVASALPLVATSGLKAFFAGYLITGLLSCSFLSVVLRQRKVIVVCLVFAFVLVIALLL